MALREFELVDGQAKAKKNIKAAIERVSARLGNTPTICRKCYVHPEVVNAYLDGSVIEEVTEEIEAELDTDITRLKREEAAVLALLQRRLRQELERRDTAGQLRRSVAALDGARAG
jgi:DNA topoisomerase-1